MPRNVRETEERVGILVLLTILLVAFLPSINPSIPALTTAASDCSVSGDNMYCSLEEAVDAAGIGDTVVVHPSISGEPYQGSAVIDDLDGFTLCGGSPNGGQYSFAVHENVDNCGVESVTPIIDASEANTNVLEIQADDVTVQELTLRWTVELPEDIGPDVSDLYALQNGLVGVLIEGDGVILKENTVQMKVGPCPGCQNPIPGIGIFITDNTEDTTIYDNIIEVPADLNVGTLGGQAGIRINAREYLVADNEIRRWNQNGISISSDSGSGTVDNNVIEMSGLNGIYVNGNHRRYTPVIENNEILASGVSGIRVDSSDGVTIRNNIIEEGLVAEGTGVHLSGSENVAVESNTIRAPIDENLGTVTRHAVSIDGGAADVEPVETPNGISLRENCFGMVTGGTDQYAVKVSSEIQEASIDARLNNWEVETWGDVSSRVLDAGITNEIPILPFILGGECSGSSEPGIEATTSNVEPGFPEVIGDASHSGDTLACENHPDTAIIDDECRFLTVQAAIDFAHPGQTVVVPASKNEDNPTPRTEALTIDENSLGESLKDLTVCGTTPNADTCPEEAYYEDVSPLPILDVSDAGSEATVDIDAPGVEFKTFVLSGSPDIGNTVGVNSNAADVSIIANTFNDYPIAIRLDELESTNNAVNLNNLKLSNEVPLQLEGGTVGLSVDAGVNDWGVYEYQLVQERPVDLGADNNIDVIPYLMPCGSHGLPDVAPPNGDCIDEWLGQL